LYLRGSISIPIDQNLIKGEWEWINAGADNHKPWQWNCLVLGVMVFTWEAGLEE
jgi:hypothetical protein